MKKLERELKMKTADSHTDVEDPSVSKTSRLKSKTHNEESQEKNQGEKNEDKDRNKDKCCKSK